MDCTLFTLRRAASAAALALACLPAFAADTVTMYVSPQGKDGASGTSAAQALPTLEAALAKGLAGAGPAKRLQVRVLPGTYRGQTLEIEPTGRAMPAIEIVRDQDNTRPVFDGGGSGATWLQVQARRAPMGRIKVFGLEVTGYSTAVSLNGSRDKADLFVSEVDLRNNVFRSIGQIAPSQTQPSTAAVRLVNADRVDIVNNRFIEIRNRQKCGLIHAVYVAHGSTNNRIEDNEFEDSCGDAIRLRDASSDNRIVNNTFIDAWNESPITDWYCDSSGREDCTKKTPECPSLGNEIAGNQIKVRTAKKPEPTKTWGADATSVCPLPPGRSAAERQRFVAK